MCEYQAQDCSHATSVTKKHMRFALNNAADNNETQKIQQPFTRVRYVCEDMWPKKCCTADCYGEFDQKLPFYSIDF